MVIFPMTLSDDPDFKVMAFLKSNIGKTELLLHTNRKKTIPSICNGAMFGDLD